MSRTFSNFKHCSNSAHTQCEYFYVINLFFDFSAIQAEFIHDYWNKSDRPDRLSRLRAFPYDCFKIYTIVPTQLYPSDRGRLSRPGRLRSSR